MISINTRIVSQFSCGAASAVATKLALAQFPANPFVILRAWILEEHEDNDRFSLECEKWFGHPITIVKDEIYGASAVEVFRRKRFIKGRNWAPCSVALKRDVLNAAMLPIDILVLGYTAEEQDRLDGFLDGNNGRTVVCPLIDRGLTKADCLTMVERAGIELPVMYRKGYNNNNCRCCVKGGMGYMNRQRVDFPEHYEALCQIQDVLGPGSYLFRDRKTNKRISLRDLDPAAGTHNEPMMSCSAQCEWAEIDIASAGSRGFGSLT